MVDGDHCVASFFKVKLAQHGLRVYLIVTDWIWCHIASAQRLKRAVATTAQDATDLSRFASARVRDDFVVNGLRQIKAIRDQR